MIMKLLAKLQKANKKNKQINLKRVFKNKKKIKIKIKKIKMRQTMVYY